MPTVLLISPFSRFFVFSTVPSLPHAASTTRSSDNGKRIYDKTDNPNIKLYPVGEAGEEVWWVGLAEDAAFGVPKGMFFSEKKGEPVPPMADCKPGSLPTGLFSQWMLFGDGESPGLEGDGWGLSRMATEILYDVDTRAATAAKAEFERQRRERAEWEQKLRAKRQAELAKEAYTAEAQRMQQQLLQAEANAAAARAQADADYYAEAKRIEDAAMRAQDQAEAAAAAAAAASAPLTPLDPKDILGWGGQFSKEEWLTGRITIRFVCEGLKAKDQSGTSDPYFEIRAATPQLLQRMEEGAEGAPPVGDVFLPLEEDYAYHSFGKVPSLYSKRLYKSEVVKKQLCPVWNAVEVVNGKIDGVSIMDGFNFTVYGRISSHIFTKRRNNNKTRGYCWSVSERPPNSSDFSAMFPRNFTLTTF